LFVADAFAYGHVSGELEQLMDEPLHRPGECALMSSEMAPPLLEPAVAITRGGLFWSTYVEISPYLEKLDRLIKRHPTRLIAPAHGNVIDDLEVVMPLFREAHRIAFGRTS
jgi:hypothetical protein